MNLPPPPPEASMKTIHPKPDVRIQEDYSFHPMIELDAYRATAISVLREKPAAYDSSTISLPRRD